MERTLKILLINPENIEKTQRVSELTPYAGLAYIAAYLEKMFDDDISVEIIEMLPQRMKVQDVLKKTLDIQYNICGITSKTYNYPFAQSLADAIKESSPKTLIVFGGAHATALPESVLENHSVDAVVPCEGEIPFKKIVENILGGMNPFENVKGVLFKSDSNIINNGRAELIHNLDELPIPAWDKYYDLNNYIRQYDEYTGEFHLMIPIFASRGCPYGCHFCQPVLTRCHRVRSVASVVDEVEYLAEKYGIKRIYFEDSIFGLKKDWFMDFCYHYIERGLHDKVKWGYETNVNNIDQERISLAKEAGCVHVYFGMESASDKVLEHLGKRATKKKLQNAIEVSKKAGINKVVGSFIFGLPYETSETAKETLDFIERSKLDAININLLDVYPGTKLYKMIDEEIGGIRWIPDKKDKWDACGRTLVKTLVNDLDSVEKLEDLYTKALQILNKKYRENYYIYARKIVKYLMFYSFHNPKYLRQVFKRMLTAYLPRIFKLN